MSDIHFKDSLGVGRGVKVKKSEVYENAVHLDGTRFHIRHQTVPAFCRSMYEVAGLVWPGEPDPLDPVRTSLRELANDPGLCTTERTRAQRALDALS